MVLDAGIEKSNLDAMSNTGKIAELVYARIKEFILIPNCWQKPNERRQLESAIRDELDYCGIDSIKAKAAKLTAELISLAEKRESEVRNS